MHAMPPFPALPRSVFQFPKERAVDLQSGLSAETLEALAAVPGNTAKSHGRPFSTWLFFRFRPETSNRAANLANFFLACRAAGWHTSLHEQLQHWREYQARLKELGGVVPVDDPAASQPFGVVLLTHKSFRWLDPELKSYRALFFAQRSFGQGMMATRHVLLDRPDEQLAVDRSDSWHGHGFEQEFDAALLLARNTRAGCEALVTAATATACDFGLQVAHRENGFVWRPDGRVREPFGFRDEISELLFLQEDITQHRAEGAPAWDAACPWEQVLFLPSNDASSGVRALAGGSFVVLRKLEQNVAAFHTWEEARTRNGHNDAGARLIGRTRDGCPLVPTASHRTDNDFNFSSDPVGAACPFHAHIRKANPRGSSGEPDERRRLFARRGMAYAPDDHLTLDDRPSKNVGLLFTGYMGNIEEQFLFMQTAWLHNASFPAYRSAGPDPLLAQSWQNPPHGCFVTARGGGYFFAPPIPWIETLNETFLTAQHDAGLH